MEYKVVGWTNYNDSNYPARNGSEEVNKAVIQELREKGYCFGGDSHAFHNGCTPILIMGRG